MFRGRYIGLPNVMTRNLQGPVGLVGLRRNNLLDRRLLYNSCSVIPCPLPNSGYRVVRSCTSECDPEFRVQGAYLSETSPASFPLG